MMKKGLRSRLAQYGDEEFALFLRRGFLKGAGFTDEALDRPIVGILSTASDFNPCHATAGRLAEAAARGVRLAGALPWLRRGEAVPGLPDAAALMRALRSRLFGL